MIRHRATFPLVITLIFLPALAGQKQPKTGAPRRPAPAAKTPAQRAEGRRAQAAGRGQKGNIDPHPGDRALDRLQRMTPEQRDRWLSTLPPARRERIEKQLGTVANMPPAAQNRVRNQLERLNSLPPEKQGQVRRSLRLFNNMPPERKAVVRKEMRRLSAMPDEERQARMNSDQFRNSYSPAEQQMMSHLTEILPR